MLTGNVQPVLMQVTSAVGEGSKAVISAADQWEVSSHATFYFPILRSISGVQRPERFGPNPQCPLQGAFDVQARHTRYSPLHRTTSASF